MNRPKTHLLADNIHINSHFILFLLSIRISYFYLLLSIMGGTCLHFGGNISFPSFELRRNSFMLMLCQPKKKNTFISSSQNGERFPLNRKFTQAVFHHRQNVLMMIYLPNIIIVARSLDSVCAGRLFSSLLLFVQEFIDPVSKRFCFLQCRAARITHNHREGSNDHDSQVSCARRVGSIRSGLKLQTNLTLYCLNCYL